MPRIAIAGFQHETNSVSPQPTTLADFETADSWPPLLTGARVVSETRGMNLPIAGFAAAAEQAAATLVPILWCAAEPAGHVEEAAFDAIAGQILDALRQAGPLDGLYLDLHGAMITAASPDGEGTLLAAIRDLVGPDMPLVISLDLHANISARMVALSDVICIYRTYPHLDMAATGARAWRWLSRCLTNGRPAKAFRQAGVLVPLPAQHTDGPPAADLYAALPDTRTDLVEMALGFTAGRAPDAGPSLVAYAPAEADAHQRADAAFARLQRACFDTNLLSPDDAVAQAMAHGGPRPVVLADVQDNPGAGASSDTTGLLRALVAAQARGALLGLMHDPSLAARAHAAGVSATIDGAMGGRSGLPDDAPYVGHFTVEHLTDGVVQYSGAMYGGGVGHLGLSCVLSLVVPGADIRVVVTSRRNQCLDLAHFTSFGLDPTSARILCVKSTAHFRAAFAPIADAVFLVAAPGLFPCEVNALGDWGPTTSTPWPVGRPG